LLPTPTHRQANAADKLGLARCSCLGENTLEVETRGSFGNAARLGKFADTGTPARLAASKASVAVRPKSWEMSPASKHTSASGRDSINRT
jgi:hypothetical protein